MFEKMTLHPDNGETNSAEFSGVKSLAAAVLERWIMDAESPHLCVLEEPLEDARIWCDIAGVNYSAFVKTISEAEERGRGMKSPEHSLAEWYEAVQDEPERKHRRREYFRFCRERGLKACSDPHSIDELIFISKMIGDDLFAVKGVRDGRE